MVRAIRPIIVVIMIPIRIITGVTEPFIIIIIIVVRVAETVLRISAVLYSFLPDLSQGRRQDNADND